MRRSIILSIFRKELLETFRDRRTVLLMVFFPILLYPVLFVGLSQVITAQHAKLQALKGRILCLSTPPLIEETLAEAEKLEVVPPPPNKAPRLRKLEARVRRLRQEESEAHSEAGAAARRALLDELEALDAHLLVTVGDSFARELEKNGSGRVFLHYDRASDASRTIHKRVRVALRKAHEKLLAERLRRQGNLPDSFAHPLTFVQSNLASEEKMGGYYAGLMLPMLLILMVLLGAFYPAIDLTAGEKERGTMQTLLTAPIRPLEIIVGKFAAVFVISMIAAICNLLSMALALSQGLALGTQSGSAAFSLDASIFVIILLLLLPTALLFSALMMAVAVFARSFKEAQNYLTPVYMIFVLPAMIASMPAVEIGPLTAFVPALNIALVVKELLLGRIVGEHIFQVLLANGIYAGLSLVFAARIFRSEQVLLGGRDAFRDVLRWKGPRDRVPGPGFGLVSYSILLVLLYYASAGLGRLGTTVSVLITQWGVIFGGTAALLAWGRFDLRETLSLRLPPARSWLAAVLLGLSSAYMVHTFIVPLQEWFLPLPESVAEGLKANLSPDDLPTWALLGAFALSPAICEELFFRGLLQRSLRSGLGKWTTIGLVGLLFGLFHVNIYRIAPTAVLGLLIAWAVWKSGSLLVGVVIHFLNNGAALLVMSERLSILKGLESPGWIPSVGFAIAFFLGILILWTLSAEGRSPVDRTDPAMSQSARDRRKV